jgi:dTDP-4-dehydrorhamnose reductase
VLSSIKFYKPDIVINCAAYTNVDAAEDVGMYACFNINTIGVKYLARATRVTNTKFITLSTDYVFDGKNSSGYLPSDTQNPINIYGMSKYL